MARRTKEEAQETRNRILDAAEKVFQDRGVSRTSLAEIASAAGVTRGAVYWHFRDKADVFNAMISRVTLPLEEAARREDPLDADPLVSLRLRMVEALQQVVADPKLRRVFDIATHKVEYVDEMSAARERHLARRNEFLGLGTRRIELAQQRGQLPARVNAAHAACALHALIDGLIQNWILDPEAFDLVTVGVESLEWFLAGLKAEAPAR